MTRGDNLPMVSQPTLPQVNMSEHGKVRYLHLGTEWVQGSMEIAKPNSIHLDYVQRMQAWLLFVQTSAVPELHAMQLGLGAAALTKNCRKVLGMRTTAIELNPQVLAACRGWFKLPAENPRLQVVLADAAKEIQNPQWWGTVDALQVDLYDEEAAAPAFENEAEQEGGPDDELNEQDRVAGAAQVFDEEQSHAADGPHEQEPVVAVFVFLRHDVARHEREVDGSEQQDGEANDDEGERVAMRAEMRLGSLNWEHAMFTRMTVPSRSAAVDDAGELVEVGLPSNRTATPTW